MSSLRSRLWKQDWHPNFRLKHVDAKCLPRPLFRARLHCDRAARKQNRAKVKHCTPDNRRKLLPTECLWREREARRSAREAQPRRESSTGNPRGLSQPPPSVSAGYCEHPIDGAISICCYLFFYLETSPKRTFSLPGALSS